MKHYFVFKSSVRLAHSNPEEKFRLQRLMRVVEFVNACTSLSDTSIQHVYEVKDHKGCLYITSTEEISSNYKSIFEAAWSAEREYNLEFFVNPYHDNIPF